MCGLNLDLVKHCFRSLPDPKSQLDLDPTFDSIPFNGILARNGYNKLNYKLVAVVAVDDDSCLRCYSGL